jgi:hypothetical protein
MKSHQPPLLVLAAAALAALPVLGCKSESGSGRTPESRETPPAGTREGSDEASSAEETLKEAGRDVRDAAREAGKEVKEAAGDVKDAAQEAGGEMGAKVDAVKQLADVKMALMADPSVDASGINVDADEATKTIHLKGTVPSAAQKSAAERIARGKAQGYKIHNVLTVAK